MMSNRTTTVSGMRFLSGAIGTPSLTQERDADTPRVAAIRDAAGRTIALTYETRTVSRPVGDFDILDSYTLVTSASGPDELRIDYRYDDTGNLVQAHRRDRTNLGTQRTQYDYADYDGLCYLQPDGEMAYARFGFRLTAVRDAIDSTVRRYRHAPDGATPTPYWTGVQTADRHTRLPAYACRICAASSVQVVDFGLFGCLIPTRRLLSASCSSGQRLASGFLQTPSHP